MTTYRIALNRRATGKLPQGDPRWADFNDSFLNVEREPVDIANAIYTGHAYTTWHNGRRKLDNFICGQHIAVDLDTEDYRSDPLYLVQHDLVRMYASIIHTTPSHTETAPRARVIFLLDEPLYNADAYTTAAEVVMAQFDGCDTVTRDASRFFYGAKNCQITLLDNHLPIAHLRRMYQIWTDKQPQRRPVAVPQPKSDKVIRMPLPVQAGEPSELEKAVTALRKIDPWEMDYNKWIGVIAAFKREFGDAALPFVVGWAQGKDGEVEREWDRLKIDRGRQSTIATVYYMAAGR